VKVEDLTAALAPYLPPAFGAFIGLANAGKQTPTQKVIGFVSGFGLAIYFGPAAAEILSLGPKATIAAGVIIAVVGMDVIGGLMAAAQGFKADPLASFKAWWAAWFNRSGP
jgi:hypothetical protein